MNHLDPNKNAPLFLAAIVTFLTQAIDQLFIWANQFLPDALEVSLKQVVVLGVALLLGKLVQKYKTIPQETYQADVAEAETYSLLKREDPLENN